MASDYSYVYSAPSKSRSAEFYERSRMGVMVGGPWPMSHPDPASADYRNTDKSPSVQLRPSPGGPHTTSARKLSRPLSMPPQPAYASRAQVSYSRESDPPKQPSAIPARINLTLDPVPSSPPTCVPWLKKMKVIKKIQRKMGMGSRGGGISPNNLPPLLFSPVHGENIEIVCGGTIAKRSNSFCKGIAFSDRPVKVNEKVCLKFAEVSTNWSGVVRFGFTSNDPNSLKSGLPRYACPDLTSKPGFWAKAFHDYLVKQDSILFYYVNQAGDVHFGINGEEMGTFFKDVDTRGPLWALLDIYGNTTAIEFVDPRAHLNNSRRSLNDSVIVRDEVDSTLLNSMSGLYMEKPRSRAEPEETLRILHYPETSFFNIHLHRTRGNNISTGKFSRMAWRCSSEYSNGYVFTSRPVELGETIIVKVLQTEPAYASSMAFGLTSCNPDLICADMLPEDSHLLLDRPEYWVVKKEAANNPVAGDELAFRITHSGAVHVSKNGGPSLVLMHIDTSIPLWAFFDLYGTTQRIILVGTIPPPSVRASAQSSLVGGKSLESESGGGPRPRLPLPTTAPPHSTSPMNNTSFQSASASKYWFQAERRHPATVPSSSNQPSNPSYLKLPLHKYKTVEGVQFELTTSRLKPITDANNTHENGGSSSPLFSSPVEGSNWCVECVACCERPVDSVFYSCGHMTFCYKCALEYWKMKEVSHCPICRAVITDVIRTYKS